MRRWGTVGVWLTTVLLSGCSGGDEPDAGFATPTTFEECNHGPRPHADDLFIPLALHWNDGDHSYDESAALFVCVNPAHGGEVSLLAPDGVTVSPPRRQVDPSGTGVLRFTVRATSDVSGTIEARWDSESIGGTQAGPEVATDDEHWSFEGP